jgi:small subunit ribosomal protein S8
MKHDLISDVLSSLKNGDKYGKKEIFTQASNIVKNILLIFQKNNYIGDFEYIDDKKGGKFRIQLLGKINDCNAIRPRLSIRKDDYEKYEKRFLPASGMGFIIVSTSKGLLTHDKAKEKGVGGVLICFMY